jgi:hypothetical protein
MVEVRGSTPLSASINKKNNMEHLQQYQLLEDISNKFKKGDIVIGTKFGAGVFDLIIYNERFTQRQWVYLRQVKLMTNDN